MRFTPVRRKTTRYFRSVLSQKIGSRTRQATRLVALEGEGGKEKSSTGLCICLWETSRALLFEMARVWWQSFFCNGNHYLRDTSTTMLISLINSATLRPLSRQWDLNIRCIVIAIPMSFMQWKMFAYYICHRQVWGIRCSGIILK